MQSFVRTALIHECNLYNNRKGYKDIFSIIMADVDC